jgi:hypothetical protein
MKACLLILLWVACSGTLAATPPKSPADPKPDQDLGDVKAEKRVKVEKTVSKEDAWTGAKYGVVGQFVQAPNILAPINPMAKPQAGKGDGNLSKDTVTGRIMGLRLIKFEF